MKAIDRRAGRRTGGGIPVAVEQGTMWAHALSPDKRKDIMPRNSPKDRPLATPAPPSDQDLPANGPGDEYAQPVVKGRVRPTRSRDEANVDPDEALPNDEEEESIADNPSREEVRFGEVKSPRS
jgi:hypothetical protein